MLRCTTNTHGHPIPEVRYNWLDAERGADDFLEGVKFGVFASMDLPYSSDVGRLVELSGL
jgi:hypothetical protein